MPRPKKDPTLRKIETLRIPVSAEEKQLIMGAALATEGEFARWARAVLTRAAEACHPHAGRRKGARQDVRSQATSRNDFSTKGADHANVGPAPARLSQPWTQLDSLPTLGSIAEIHRGLEFVKAAAKGSAEPPLTERFVSQKRRAGFKKGLAPKASGFYAFQLPRTSFLSVRPEDQKNEAWKLPWDRPKVFLNAIKKSNKPWRFAACADFNGLVAHQDFIGIWPHDEAIATVLEAVLNGPIANAFVATHDTNHNGNKIVHSIPVPLIASGQMAQLEQLVAEYKRAMSDSPPGASLDFSGADLVLRKIDAAVLEAYGLPPRVEREILDLFNGASRPVPFDFADYFPADFESCFSLHEYLSPDFEKNMSESVRVRFANRPAEHILQSMRAAVEAFKTEQ